MIWYLGGTTLPKGEIKIVVGGKSSLRFGLFRVKVSGGEIIMKIMDKGHTPPYLDAAAALQYVYGVLVMTLFNLLGS